MTLAGERLLRSAQDAAERQRLAEMVAQAKAAYRDDAYPQRVCDRCRGLYRGPAVYCSLQCALDDA